MRKLFLDDLRTPFEKGYDVVRSNEEAIAYVKRYGCPEIIAFDYHLGFMTTVMPFVHFLIDEDIRKDGKFIPENFTYTVHSNDPRAKGKIGYILDAYLESRKKN